MTTAEVAAASYRQMAVRLEEEALFALREVSVELAEDIAEKAILCHRAAAAEELPEKRVPA